jgi:hypothetical protein
MSAQRVVVVGLWAGMLAAGCGGTSTGGGGGGGTASDITISGTLSTATAGLTSSSSVLLASRRAAAVNALAGYKLYCVTFSTTPASGTADADASGVVSLTLAAKDVPFGCFILNAEGTGVATLMFGAENAQTVALSGSTNLGTITVDATSGVAQAEVPSGGTVVTSTPAGVSCPLGTWGYTSGAESGTTWIAQDGAGQYAVSVSGTGPNGTTSFSNLPSTYSNGTLTIGPYNPEVNNPGNTCFGTKTEIVTLTANSACTEMTGTGVKSGCTGQCGCEPDTITVTRM